MFSAFFERTGGSDAKFYFGVLSGYRDCRSRSGHPGFFSRSRLCSICDWICAGL